MCGAPAMVAKVGSQSSCETVPLRVTLAAKWPGQRKKVGTRQAPSQLEFFSPRKGAAGASGQVLQCGPLSVGHLTTVYSSLPGWRWFLRTWVRKCMRVPFHRLKKGLPASTWRATRPLAAATVSSQIVAMRVFVSAPVPRRPAPSQASSKVLPAPPRHAGGTCCPAIRRSRAASAGGRRGRRVVLAEPPRLFSAVAIVRSVFRQPSLALGRPTCVMPERTGTLPPMNAAHPVVPRCCAVESVKRRRLRWRCGRCWAWRIPSCRACRGLCSRCRWTDGAVQSNTGSTPSRSAVRACS